MEVALALDLPLLGEVRVHSLAIGGGDLLVISLPAGTPDDGPAVNLTEAERQVLGGLLRGETNREIAERRGRSVRTVTTQVEHIFRKLGVRSRAELARRVMAPQDRMT